MKQLMSDDWDQVYKLRGHARTQGQFLSIRDAETAVRVSRALTQLGIRPLGMDNIALVPAALRPATRVMIRVIEKTTGREHQALIDELIRLDDLDAKKRRGWSRGSDPFVPWRVPQPRGVMSHADWQQKAGP